ncbi:GMC family oxidoreductase [Ideonella livida]|uniref:Glucose-methanol-choline oxidoreductase n=1 Tax=Ideonella livida TaxID=2707176 RepID=A0A7C9PJ69_9BURK|nr:GMC family oxidoreductase N-terminal domain-containing protein [Ideonella livida]NDY93335.1 glucose-methanol-choline oxidoreductase [Ideonella livida]
MDFDYVIVGGGSAGCVLAARLSEDPEVRVALLEAGPADTSRQVQWPAGLAVMARTGSHNWGLETTPQPGLNGRRGYQPRGKVLGGSGSVNAMVYVRGHPSDYDHWRDHGAPGWGWREVLPWFRRAEHNERGASRWHGTGGPLNVADLRSPPALREAFIHAGVQAGWAHNPDFNGPELEGVGAYQVTQRDGQRCSTARAYLSPHLERPNLKVYTWAEVQDLVVEDGRVRGVRVRLAGDLQTLQARHEVLLCAGALLSPAVLLRSGIGEPAELLRLGLPVRHALPGVGLGLHDHPDVVLAVQAPQATGGVALSVDGLAALARAWGPWRRERRGLISTNFAEAGGFLRSHEEETVPDLQWHFVVAQLVDHGRELVWGNGFSLHVCLLQPRSRGRVSLESPHAEVPPRIDPAFLSDPDDLDRLVRGVQLSRRVLAQPALMALGGVERAASRAARTENEIAAFIREHADTIYHPVGSCRMGQDRLAVVSPTLRVQGLHGLRVVDASVMPRIVSGNTHAAVVMIAERAAAMVRAARLGRDEMAAATLPA